MPSASAHVRTNPLSGHLQWGITLYSKYKNETQIRKWGKWCGIYVVLLLLLLLLLLLFKRKINLERNFVFVVK